VKPYELVRCVQAYVAFLRSTPGNLTDESEASSSTQEERATTSTKACCMSMVWPALRRSTCP
jgi:hypothetical protein